MREGVGKRERETDRQTEMKVLRVTNVEKGKV
jgi:hypothetical protein